MEKTSNNSGAMTSGAGAAASVADKGNVRLGAGLRATATPAPSSVTDKGKVRLGAGLRRN